MPFSPTNFLKLTLRVYDYRENELLIVAQIGQLSNTDHKTLNYVTSNSNPSTFLKK